MWLWWSGLSRCSPSQQSGEVDVQLEERISIRAGNIGPSGQVGHFLICTLNCFATTGQLAGAVLEGASLTPALPPQVQ